MFCPNLFRKAISVAGLVVMPFTAAAGDYPNHSIKIVVPVPPGGTADIVPRMIGQSLEAKWGQPVIIENRPGAGLNIGAEAVAKAQPDGYTLLATPPGPLVSNQYVFPHLGYDPNAFTPVSVLAKGPFVLFVRANLAVSSLQQLIAYCKANPGKLNFASSGIGSPPHLAADLLATEANIQITHVAYKGLTPALRDVVAGQVDAMFHDPASTLALIQSGQVRAIGVSGPMRLHELPNVPAIAEFIPGFEAGTWYGVVAPPRTQPDIAAELSRAMAEAVREPNVAQMLKGASMEPVGSTPAEAAAFFKAESVRWRNVIVGANQESK